MKLMAILGDALVITGFVFVTTIGGAAGATIGGLLLAAGA
jgi:hypothetical protein